MSGLYGVYDVNGVISGALSGGSLLLTLRGMFFSYFSDTRELNTVVAKLYPLKMSQMPLYAVGVVPTRRRAYLRVSGPQGRLRACTKQLTAAPLTAMKKNSYNTHH